MRIALTIAVGIALLVLESVFVGAFHVDIFLPHVAGGLIMYLALQKEFVEGGLEAVAFAWCADLLGAAPPGVIALGLTLLFFTLRIAGQRLSHRSLLIRAAMSMVAAALMQTFVLGVLLVIQGDLSLFATFALAALPSCVAAPIGLAVAWWPLGRIDGVFQQKHRTLLKE